MPHAIPPARQAQKARQQCKIGQAHARAARWDAAVHAHAEATRLAPRDAVYALHHARALWAQGALDRAGAEGLRAFRLDPQQQAARRLAVEALMQLARYDEVVALLQTPVPGTPPDQEAHALLGSALQRLRRPTEAIAAYFDALALKPHDAATHHNLGLCFEDLQMFQEAAQCFNTALILGVGPLALGTRGLALLAARRACHWEDFDASLAQLRAELQLLPAGASLRTVPFAHVAFTDSRAEQHRAAASNARFGAAAVRPLPPPTRAAWQPGARPLRLGYVSSDFHDHATANLMAEVLEQHDRTQFEVRLYSHGPADGSAMRARLEAGCGIFVEVQQASDRQVAQRIRDDGIDLLIDLKGHTQGSRLPIFAHRPAPVQASFLGFPGSTGADWIDYMIGDPIVTPLAHAADYSEKIAQLPQCYQPNDRQRPLPVATTRAAHGLPEDALVLCGFNQPYKLSAAVLDSWCRLLQALPDAVLWLFEWGGQALPNLQREAAARGIAAQRLIGAPWRPLHEHIARLVLADVFIDTWPYNAHTTASDALWAGVPVVTTTGETFASRVGTSLLHAVGLPELACADLAAYEAQVLALAGDAARRQRLREHLLRGRTQAPLFDSAGFTRALEALYRQMALRHAQGLAPEHLPARA